jgi:hypothetical protein
MLPEKPFAVMLEGAEKIGLAVQDMGSSKGIVIPAEWRRELEIDEESLADAEYDRTERTITYHF